MNKSKINIVFTDAKLDRVATVANFATIQMNVVCKDSLLTTQHGAIKGKTHTQRWN